MKKRFLKEIMALSLLGMFVSTATTLAQPATAQASVKSVKYTNIKDTKVHVSTGYMYTSAKLTRKAHNAKNYKYTTFTRTEQATVKKSNGKTAVYQYIKAGSVKGWIWHSYIKSGVAPKSVKTYGTIMSKYVLGTAINNGESFAGVNSFEDLGEDVYYHNLFGDHVKDYSSNINALENIHNLFESKLSSSTNSSLTAMISKAKSDINTDGIEDEIASVAYNLGEAIKNLN